MLTLKNFINIEGNEFQLSSGNKYHIDFDEIANIDIFIDKLRYVALG